MAGYSRQSAADIIASAIIRAAPVNAEYNAIRDAFAFVGGHKHDGSSTEGAYVPLIADTDALNKVVIDTSNNRIGVFVEVSSAAVEQIRIQDGAIVPVTDNDIDLGASGTKFKNLYVNGIASIGSITLSGGTIDGTVIGGTTPAAGTFTTLDATGNATIGGTLGVTGVTTLGTANITSVDLDSGAIDGTTIGAATPAAGTFTTLTANTSLTAATADINGGTIDGATIGATSAAAATVTDLTASGTSTLTTVDINAGNIDGTTIGATSAAAGSFTTVSTSGQATLATADINGGSIDNTVIGATTAAAITGTTITGTSFVGPLTGVVTGNVTGDVTGDLTGDVTGNITSSGSSSFNNVTIDGTLNMNAGTTATITNLTSPTNTNDAATKGYVDTSISNLVDSAPGTLDTLNELAAALGDDPDFATTITNSIATKLPLAGGTMTGAIAMSTNKITGLGDPTAAQDAMTKAYADATYLALSGGTMTGAIDMGSQKITTTYTPTNAADLTTKTYVDTILGSGEDAVAAAAAAATSETNAATSETNAANSASAAATSEANAAASYDSFDDRYLGAKASAPTLDNDGDALIIGALYFNTSNNIMYVYGSGGWQAAGSSVNGTSDRQTYTAIANQTVFAATYDAGYVDVYLNGVKLLAGTDFTAVNGTSITLASGAAVNDIVDIVAYGTFVLADHLTETQSDAKYVEVAGDTMTGNLDITGTLTSDGLTVDGVTAVPVVINSNQTDTAIHFKNSGYDDAYIEYNDNNLFFYTDNKRFLSLASNGDISFYEDTGTTAKFFWDASAESLGLGATSFAGETLRMERSGDMILGLFSGASSSTFLNMGTTSNRDAGQIGYTQSSNHMFFRVNDAERMRIDSSGNVGIGTSSPISKLEVNSGDIRINDQTNGATRKIYFDMKNSGGAQTDFSLQANNGNFLFYSESTGSERMRIDSSGNLLVSATTTSGFQSSSSESGTIAYAAGGIASNSPSNDVAGVFNRLGNAGAIVQLKDDGTTVGNILTGAGGYMHIIGGNNTFGSGIAFNNQTWNPTNASGTITDNHVKLGDSGSRFTDLYLSGGVYLGGTGSANKLDDYEEGTWLVEMFDASTGGNKSASNATGYYTKIGRMVHITFAKYNLSNAGMTGTGAVWISLPFTPTGETASGSINIRQFSFPSTVEYLVPKVSVGTGRFPIQMVRSGNTSTEVTWANISNTITDIGSLSITYMA